LQINQTERGNFQAENEFMTTIEQAIGQGSRIGILDREWTIAKPDLIAGFVPPAALLDDVAYWPECEVRECPLL
jgi:hypothetical protein